MVTIFTFLLRCKMEAAGRGWLKVVAECLRAGQSVNAEDSVGHNLRFQRSDYNRVFV